MTITSFLQLVELRTKVASVIPFLLASIYTFYTFGTFNFTNALLMFLSMLIFDMSTTAINNYIDYTSAIKKEGYGYEVHNAISRHQLSVTNVRFLIYTMLLISSVLGICLVLRTNIIVLFLGMLCFAIGIVYTFGPLPISRTPLGEIFSGLTMGLLLPFITIYIHVFDQHLLSITYYSQQLLIRVTLKELFGIAIFCVPLICTIANIMLANNLCDMEEDLINKRYTLPIYLGRESGIKLWKSLYYLSFLAIIVGVYLKFLPWVSLFTFGTLLPLLKHMKLFKTKQLKSETFVVSIKNFLLFNGVYLITLIVGCFLPN